MKHIKTFEGFLNEAEPPMGPKAKKFGSSREIDNQYDWFTDADGGEDTLPDEYQRALKTLNIKADDAIVCFFDAVGSAQDVLDAATKSGLKYIEVSGTEDDDAGSGGIVFSSKQ